MSCTASRGGGGAPFLGGGHDNQFRNNLIIECSRAGIHVDDRGIPRKYDTNSNAHMRFLKQIDYTKAPWSQRYPDLPGILVHPTLPTGNVFTNNAIIGCKTPIDLRISEASRPYVRPEGNWPTDQLPGLVDPVTLQFQLPKDSVLYKNLPTFQPIPFDQIGLQLDEYRLALPTAEETGRNTNRPPRRTFDSNVDMERSNELAAPRK